MFKNFGPARILELISDAVDAINGKAPPLGRVAAAASVPVALSNEDAAKVPALGKAAAPAAVPVVPVVDDAPDVAPVVIAIVNANSTQSAQLPAGVYRMTSDLDVFWLEGLNPTATANSDPLWAFQEHWINITTANNRVAAIRRLVTTGAVKLKRVR